MAAHERLPDERWSYQLRRTSDRRHRARTDRNVAQSPRRRDRADGNIIIQEYGNGVYSTTSNGQVFARDAATGTEHWSLQLGGAFSPPVMDATGVFYFGSLGGSGFFAIDTVTRQQRWTYPVPGDIRPSPALANGVVYFVDATNSRLYALDAANGGHIFDVPVPGTASWAPMVGADDVFVATTNGVAAFDRSSGSLEWQQPSGIDVVQPALLADGNLLTSTSYNTTSGVAYVLDRVNGTTLREFPLGATVRGSPRIDRDDTAYFTTDTGIQAFQDAATPLWQSPLTGDIIVGDGCVVVFPLVETLAIIGP